MILYFLTIGEKIKEKTFDFVDTEDQQLLPVEQKTHSVRKMAMSGVITVTAIVLIITKVVNNGVGAFLGASALVITGCVDIKTALRKVNWEVVVMAGSLLAFASGFNRSGASDLCVSMILRFFGDGTSFIAIYAAMLLLAIVLTNVIDNFATAALLAPIVISIALRFGVNATAALFGVLVACNVAYATPISCPCISMTISGGYRFKDYLRFGGLLSVIEYAVVLLVINFVYGL